jgi:hypothetical protein
MTRKLLVVFTSGIILALVLISLAWVAGGQRFVSDIQHRNGWAIALDDDDDFGDHEQSGPRVSKTLAYDGSQPLTLDAPVNVKFVRGTANQVTVAGRREMIDAVRWQNGRLFLADNHPRVQHTIEVTVVAPQIPGVVLKGAGNIELNGLAQPALAIALSGAGSIDASGKVDTIRITASGAGNIDMSDVAAKDASIEASGIGNVELAASGKVTVAISGAGNVSLHKKPAELTTNITGIGSIDRDY